MERNDDLRIILFFFGVVMLGITIVFTVLAPKESPSTTVNHFYIMSEEIMPDGNNVAHVIYYSANGYSTWATFHTVEQVERFKKHLDSIGTVTYGGN